MELKVKVYRLLCHGYAQRKIAVISGVTRQRVNQLTKDLLAENYVYCVNPNGSPKLYKATDTPLQLERPLSRQIRGGRKDDLLGVCRAHSLAFVLPLERPPKLPINWLQEWSNNGTRYFQMKRKFDIGPVTIRLICGKNESKIVFWLPERFLNKDEIKKYEKLANRYIDRVSNWFQKRYACRLGIPKQYQKPHFAFPEDPEILHLTKKYDVEAMRAWVDNSQGVPEWETNEIDVARAKIEGPERLLTLEQKVGDLYKMVGSIDQKVDLLVNALLCTPPKKDEFKDVV